jgi:hypothetical protein
MGQQGTLWEAAHLRGAREAEMATFLVARRLSDRDRLDPDSVTNDHALEVAENTPDWEKIGQNIAARYPNTLAKLAE